MLKTRHQKLPTEKQNATKRFLDKCDSVRLDIKGFMWRLSSFIAIRYYIRHDSEAYVSYDYITLFLNKRKLKKPHLIQ